MNKKHEDGILLSINTRSTVGKKITALEEENRGLKKRLKAITKSSENNYRGMLFWKTRATKIETGLVQFNNWLVSNRVGE